MRQPRHSLAKRLLFTVVALLFGSATSAAESEVHARFVQVAELPWTIANSVPGESPWSPQGNQLAVVRGGILALFDVTNPQALPRELLSMPHPIRGTSWSPDGKWIACMTKLRTQSFVWVVRAEDGARHLAGVGDVWPFLWISNRTLVGYQHEDGEEILRFEVPARDGQSAAAFDSLPRLVYVRHRSSGFGLARMKFGVGPTLTPLPNLGRVLLRTRFPDHRRFMVTQLERDGRTVVVDANGIILADIGNRVSPGSATSEGRFVAGFHEVSDGHTISSSEVLLHDLHSGREVPVRYAPHSVAVQCAPRGRWVALQSLHGGLEIGRLEIDTVRTTP